MTDLLALYNRTRGETVEICKPLEIEDYVVQPSSEVSPPKWHLGHTTWFFEQAILKRFSKDHCDFNRLFLPVFNSREKYDLHK